MPRSRRSIVGWLFVGAGALLAVQVGARALTREDSSGWLLLIVAVALVVAFELLFVIPSRHTLFRAALQFAAVGWAISALGVVAPLDLLVVSIGVVLAAVGMIAAAILAPLTRRLRGLTGLVFVIAMALGGAFQAFRLTALSAPLVVLAGLFGVALILEGILLVARRGRG